MNYNVHLIRQEKLTLHIDDLIGIVQQLEAISQGWGMDFDCFELDEDDYPTGIIWERI